MGLRDALLPVLWEAFTPSTDIDGVEVDGWAAPVTVYAFAFDPGGSATLREVDTVNRMTLEPTLYLPLGSPVAARGRVTVAGVRYLVDGVPRPWSHPSLSMSGVVASLRRVDG